MFSGVEKLVKLLIWTRMIVEWVSKRVILVAYTHQAIVKDLRTQLTRAKYALLHVTSKHEAFDHFERLKANIDIAIIDLDHGGTSGLDVIRQLVRPPHEKRPRIIATTAVDAPLLKDVVTQLGVDVVVQMPFPVRPAKEYNNRGS